MIRGSSVFVLFMLGVLLATSLLSISPYSFHSNASGSSTGVSFLNLENFNDYGQFGVNDTLEVGSGANLTSPVSSVSFGFPSAYNGHIFAQSASLNGGAPLSSTSILSSVSNNTLKITVSLPSGKTLSAGSPGNISLKFYVVGTYVNQNTTAQSCITCYYGVQMLLYPSLSVSSSSMSLQSNITFTDPSVTSPANSSALASQKFSQQTTSAFFRWYNSTSLNANTTSFVNVVHSANVSISSGSSSAGVVDFRSIERTISVTSSGSLLVTDSITFTNRGPNTLSSLNFTVLTSPTAASVTVLPSTQPYISNYQSGSVTSGVVDVLSASGDTVEPNATVLVSIQYPLGQQYWSYSGGTYKANIPLAVPVNALIEKYQISYNIPAGFIAIQSPPPVDLMNTLGVPGNASLSYRVGLGSAYSFVLPIAAIVFLAVFIAALVFKPRGGEKKSEEIETTLASLIKAAEDKVSGTNDILSELKSKGSSVTRLDLSTARSRIEDFRSKSAGRFASIKTELGPASVSSAAALSQVAADDREFDRATKDLLNAYDLFISRRMKEDSFARAQQNNERRIQRITNSLLDELQNLRREYEEEQ